MLLVANLSITKQCKTPDDNHILVHVHVYWHSSDSSTQRELSKKSQHDRVKIVFKNFCVLVLWTKVASECKGVISDTHLQGFIETSYWCITQRNKHTRDAGMIFQHPEQSFQASTYLPSFVSLARRPSAGKNLIKKNIISYDIFMAIIKLEIIFLHVILGAMNTSPAISVVKSKAYGGLVYRLASLIPYCIYYHCDNVQS